MKTTIIAVIEIPIAPARHIVMAADPLLAFRSYCADVHAIVPESISDYDLKQLRSNVATALGEEILAGSDRQQTA